MNLIAEFYTCLAVHFKAVKLFLAVFMLFIYFFTCLLNEIILFTHFFNKRHIKYFDYYNFLTYYEVVVKIYKNTKSYLIYIFLNK